MAKTTVERAPITAETLRDFAGKWISIRDGEVVASAESLEELRANGDVRLEDAVFLVPESPSYFY